MGSLRLPYEYLFPWGQIILPEKENTRISYLKKKKKVWWWFSSPLVAPTVYFLSGSPWNKLIVLLLPAWKFILNLENDLSFHFIFKLPKLPYISKVFRISSWRHVHCNFYYILVKSFYWSMNNSLTLYVIWHDPLKMCSKRFCLPVPIIVQLSERTHCWFHRDFISFS